MMAAKAGVKAREGVLDTTNEDQRMFSHDQNSDPGQVIMKNTADCNEDFTIPSSPVRMPFGPKH